MPTSLSFRLDDALEVTSVSNPGIRTDSWAIRVVGRRSTVRPALALADGRRVVIEIRLRGRMCRSLDREALQPVGCGHRAQKLGNAPPPLHATGRDFQRIH